MRAMLTNDPGLEDRRYTVSTTDGPLGAFDTQEEVVEIVRKLPDNACTIRFGAGVHWDGIEAAELARKIEAL